MTLGQSIRKIRKDRGYTLEVLEMKSGVTGAAISRWEQDKADPMVTLLCCVADVLEVSLDVLVGRKSNCSDGEWTRNENGDVACSKCGARPLFMKSGNTAKRVRTPYCPKCGAKMSGG